MAISPRREVGEFRKRYKWMALAAVLVFAGILVRLFRLQVVEREAWLARARDNITWTTRLPAPRGVIRDRAGREVAINRPSYVVRGTPIFLDDAAIERVAELMGLDEAAERALAERIARVPERRRDQQVELFRDVSDAVVASLITHRQELAGIAVVARPVRSYPFGHLAGHAIGYLSEVNAEDVEADPDYRAGDSIGRVGVERRYEATLRGRAGHRTIVVDARGRRQLASQSFGVASEETEQPSPGNDLFLTIDMSLMQTIDRAFSGHPSGAAVVVDVHTGRIRALFSKPTYDPNDFVSGMTSDEYHELEEDPFRPLIDKTIYESYFPGSTFKPFSALAALEKPGFDPTARVECIGYYQIGTDRKRCTSAHGDMEMVGALSQSCNVYFYNLAERVGLEPINGAARRFGLGARTDIGINSEASGFLPSREWYAEHYGRFRVGDTLNVAIGQGNTRSTLLQLALAYAALANRGTLYYPQLVEGIRTPQGDTVEEFEPRIRQQLTVNPAHLELIDRGLWGAVNQQGGTSYDVRIPNGVEISGKTGTAEVMRGSLRRGIDPYFERSHAWFAGYAPSRNPEVAIIVLVEHGGAGGRAAAPIAIRILQDYLGQAEAR